jgi:N-acetylmuramic acid 6-phosphate etherase
VGNDLDRLATEAVRPDFADLDARPTRALVELLNDEDTTVPAAVRRATGPIARAVDAVADRLAAGGRLVYVGAGSAGLTAALDAAECGPTFGAPPGQVVAVVAGGLSLRSSGREELEDDGAAGGADLAAVSVSSADAVVGVSASGRTPYVLGAISHARAAAALTIGVCCNHSAPLSAVVDLPIEVVVGPEVIAGSTRLKAATAQKLVLNTLSTLVMVRLGHTYGALMVDVRPENEKLRRRAIRAVSLATGLEDEAAERALGAADGQVKVAIVAALAGVAVTEARERLAAAGGHVRRALALP